MNAVFVEAGHRLNYLFGDKYSDMKKEIHEHEKECRNSHRHALIHLAAEKEEDFLMQRISKRKQPGDSLVSLDYIKLLEELYEIFFLEFEGQKIKINVKDEDINVMFSSVEFLKEISQ